MTTTERVVDILRETLGLAEDHPVTVDQLLFYDLSCSSLDILDLIFRLEDGFDIQIPEGTIYTLARGAMEEAAFCKDGHLTPVGRDQLMRLLSDTPQQMFPARVHSQSLPQYCTVGAIVRLVEHKLGESV